MATINTNKADKLMLYLRGNGYARSGAEPLGPDIVAFLEDNGHTFAGSARNQIEKMSSSQWNKMQSDWIGGHSYIEAFFGLNPYLMESLYMKPQARINSNSHKIEAGKNTTGPAGVGGAKGGTGLIKPKYAFNGFNGTGWDTINLLYLANHGELHPDYITKLKNLNAGKTFGDEFEQWRTNLHKGTKLADYRTSPPVISGAPVTRVTTAPLPATEEEEEEEEEKEEEAEVISYEIDDDLLPAAITEIIGTSSAVVPTVSVGERKVSSKSYAELDITKTIPVTSGLIEVNMKTLPKTQGVSMFISVSGDPDPDAFEEYEELMEQGVVDGKVINVSYIEGDEEITEELLVAPKVKFIVNVDEGKVYIVINGQMLVAARGSEEYTFTNCAIKIHDPTSGKEGVADVLLDGASMEYGKWIKKDGYYDSHFDYGFPINGVLGLQDDCYIDNYEPNDDDVEMAPVTLSANAMGEFMRGGGRPIVFGKPTGYIYDIGLLDEKYLQPLDLNFDVSLTDKDAVIFVLNYGGKLSNKTNLFPGQIDDKVAGFTELQMFSYPDDIRNVRPMNNESVVMLQNYSGRKRGEGIKDIMIDSTNLVGRSTYTIDGVDYDSEVYTQVKITFEEYKVGKTEYDETSVLIPDGDMVFRGMDNSNTELTGEVMSLDPTSELGNVIIIKGKAQEIYDILETQRHSARISSKYNAIDSIDKQIITKSLLVEQTVTTSDDKKESMYYLIVGTGKTTKVIKMDMGAVK